MMREFTGEMAPIQKVSAVHYTDTDASLYNFYNYFIYCLAQSARNTHFKSKITLNMFF